MIVEDVDGVVSFKYGTSAIGIQENNQTLRSMDLKMPNVFRLRQEMIFVAMMCDLASFGLMVNKVGLIAELNPVAHVLYSISPLGPAIVKILVALIGGRVVRWSRSVSIFATILGIVGAVSNILGIVNNV